MIMIGPCQHDTGDSQQGNGSHLDHLHDISKPRLPLVRNGFEKGTML